MDNKGCCGLYHILDHTCACAAPELGRVHEQAYKPALARQMRAGGMHGAHSKFVPSHSQAQMAKLENDDKLDASNVEAK